ncbi:DUF3325 domain-containing protein [Hydrogenophaga sp. BPS33]|uniref:DUF3325 domain-containing protein n=1 Tax=Hydrogenophaga sp. BPS33 TaxID=2651974 RepID=UPI00131FF3B8|nr:DUF3325 domain-containing protein [Hydrogenophaga sp. BPS33]QHE83641.1 DUF3325 domain-containing protein [Hydrogenophaga sp. BPS33]
MTSVHLGVLLLGLLGFTALALATERHAHHLLRRTPAPGWRRLARAAGWGLLLLSLVLSVAALDVGIGVTLWLGWLSIAALTLVFALPAWPWRPPARVGPLRKPMTPGSVSLPPRRRVEGRRVFALWLVVVLLVYGLALQAVPVKPLLRSDAIEGRVGPWTFRLAESERRGPDLVAMDIPMKAYHVRFDETGDMAIREAYLRVNKPRSLRAPGIVLNGTRWERHVNIQLPANATADSALWLTVVGKDGSVHQAAVRMGDVSPATVAWLERRS